MSAAEWVAIALFFCGAIFGFLGNYFKFSNEFNFVKGQLTLILDMKADIDALDKKYGKIEAEHTKLFKDVDKAHLKIKHIEHKVFGGFP